MALFNALTRAGPAGAPKGEAGVPRPWPRYRALVKRVMDKCDRADAIEASHKDKRDSFMDKAFELTGLQYTVIRQLAEDTYSPNYDAVSRFAIYNQMAGFCLSQGKVPTTRELFQSLANLIPNHIDLDSFRKLLLKFGYVWMKTSEKKHVVVERPFNTFERFNYLKDILRHRGENRSIFFVDENSFDTNGNYYSLDDSLKQENNRKIYQKVIYAVSKEGILGFKCIEEFSAQVFERWISEDLIKVVPQSSVIVINKADHHCRTWAQPPAADSLKVDLKEWLDNKNVPYDDTMTKTELYALVEKYTDRSENVYVVDNLLKVNDHVLLRIPDCVRELTPAWMVFELIKSNLLAFIKGNPANCQSLNLSTLVFKSVMDSIPAKHLVDYSDRTAVEEQQMYLTELKVDKVLDDLIECSRQSLIPKMEDSDVPSSGSDDEYW